MVIAGFGVVLWIREDVKGFQIPRSWQPFIVDLVQDPVLRLNVRGCGDEAPDLTGWRLIADSFNDVGKAGLYVKEGRFGVTVSAEADSLPGYMTLAEDFSEAEVRVPLQGGQTFIINSLLRIAFSQVLLRHDAFMLHASAVVAGGEAYLFMGKSGTGKSTHSRMWLETFPDSRLLNDDVPVIRLEGEGVVAYGSPWSGKTHCYKNESAPVRVFVRLSQASENRYKALEGIDMFTAIYPGVSLFATSSAQREAAAGIIAAICGSVEVGSLECLPNREAALLCRRGAGNND